jgi:alkylation response protein AidB-like acyl-CoA dehydrogenase
MADADELAMLRHAVVGSLGKRVADADVAAAWRRVSALGWAGAFVPGPSSAGVAEAVVVAEECGRAAAALAAPALVVGAAAAVLDAGHGGTLLERGMPGREPVVWGDTLASSSWRPGAAIAVVPGIDWATQVLVSLGEGIDARAVAHGVDDLGGAARSVAMIDADLAAWSVELDGAGWEPEPHLDVAFLRRLAMVTAAAQSCGLLDRALRLTVDYARDRVAFGRPIGSFQAVKHLLADVEVGLEATRALVADAVQVLDAASPGGGLACAAASRFAGRATLDGLQACVQVHGGIGVTMECELHVLIRRATALRFLYLEPFAPARRLVDEYANAKPVHA